MSDAMRAELERIVEKTVRPVVATRGQKHKMREELIAHLTAVVEDQLAELGDERAALVQAQKRFGDPASLTQELQRSIPRVDGFAAAVEKINQPVLSTDRKTIWQLITHQCAAMLGLFLLLFPLIAISEILRVHRGESEMALRISLGYAVVVSTLYVLFLIVPALYGERLFGPRQARDWPRLLTFGLASAAAFPGLAFVMYWISTGDLAGSRAQLRFACWFIPLGPALFFVIGRLLHQELSYERSWAAINVDE